MNATELWQLSPEQFNEWRRENDYPRIWALLVASLPISTTGWRSRR